jgi:hypothetical protein
MCIERRNRVFRIVGALVSNIASETGYSDLRFVWFCQFLQVKAEIVP